MKKTIVLMILFCLIISSFNVLADWGAKRTISSNDVTLIITPGDGFDTFTITETIGTGLTISSKPTTCGLINSKLTCDFDGTTQGTLVYKTTGTGSVSGSIVGVSSTTYTSGTKEISGDTTIPNTPTCSSGLTSCSGKCVNLQTDASNCGSCGTACNIGISCSNGVCTSSSTGTCTGTVPENSILCLNSKSTGLSADKAISLVTTVCSAPAVDCEYVCKNNYLNCNNKCVNTQTDSSNCGACSTACKTGEACSAGKCTVTATCGNSVIEGTEECDKDKLGSATCVSKGYASGTLKCDSACKLDTSWCVAACAPSTCDSAGTSYCDSTTKTFVACPSGQTCSGGQCATAGSSMESGCSTGTEKIGGKCTDILTKIKTILNDSAKTKLQKISAIASALKTYFISGP